MTCVGNLLLILRPKPGRKKILFFRKIEDNLQKHDLAVSKYSYKSDLLATLRKNGLK
jgi:hypothetical protein